MSKRFAYVWLIVVAAAILMVLAYAFVTDPLSLLSIALLVSSVVFLTVWSLVQVLFN